jgi:hypothetical protein
MKTQTITVKERGGDKEAEFSYEKPQTPEELSQLTGVQNPFQFVVELYEQRLKKRLSVILFDHVQKVGGKKKTIKALTKAADIQKVISRIKLVRRRKKNGELSPQELREQIRSRLIAAGRTEEEVDGFMTEYDSNVELANSADAE